MTMIRSLVVMVAVMAGLAAGADQARAAGPGCNGPFCNQAGYPKNYTLAACLFGNKTPLPAFQAAPWYLYWPYDAHFLTPAPVTGAFYGPPTPGNFPVNPYFPAPNYGHFGPMPGGPFPRP